jgi:hypothetical protein
MEFSYLAASKIKGSSMGEVSEWLKEHAWKACVPQKGIVGSNPTLSAKNYLCQLMITN